MKKLYSYFSVLAFLLAFNGLQAQVLLVEGFEDGLAVTDFPGWATGLPPFSIDQQNPCTGNQSTFVELFSSSTAPFLTYATTTNSHAIATGSDVKITFEYKLLDHATGNPVPAGTDFGSFSLYYTVDGGTTWSQYGTISKTDLPTANCSVHTSTIAASNVPSGSTFGWKIVGAWNATTAGDYDFYVDNFSAIEQVSCIQPVHPTIDPASITFNGADISWTDFNSPAAGSYEVSWCLSPGAPSSGNPTCSTAVTTTLNPYPITGLLDGTTYYVYVRAVCGASSNSEWNGPAIFQTTAIGTDCNAPIEVNAAPTAPVASDLPYTNISQTDKYGFEEYSSTPGANCGGSTNLMDGYEVVYHYTSLNDDILTIDVTGLTGTNVGVFVYDECSDIGSFCLAGATTTNGTNLNINSLSIPAGEDFYIVIASTDASGLPANSNYTLHIEGFDCPSWIPPAYASGVTPPLSFVSPIQTLASFSNTPLGVKPTIDFATLKWYQDNNGTQGALITNPLENVALTDLGCFWVTQNVGTCESPALQVCFDEFDCNTDLGGITSTTADSTCDSGIMVLTATAATPNIYWYKVPTGGSVQGVGGTFTTDNLTSTESYWVAEAFLGYRIIPQQGNLGPVTSNSSGNDNAGLTFNASQPFSIMDVQVYVTSNDNSITLQLEDANGVVIEGPKAFAVNSGTLASPTANTVTLNWDIPQTGNYSLIKNAGASMLYEPSATATFPYALSDVGEIIGGSSSTNSNYYYFFNWTITGPGVLCESSPRQEVIATVYDTKPITVSADDLIVCINSATMLHVQSVDPAYNYTWTWIDAAGQTQTQTGADISVTVKQNTTYSVAAFNPTTTCGTTSDIFIEVKGSPQLDLNPTQIEMCVGETVELKAGGLYYDFENTVTGWTKANNSTATSSYPSSSADWQLVDSPAVPAGSLEAISSNDNSHFYLAQANLLGPGASLETDLISPVINMVGVGSASLSFSHYLKYNNNQTTDGVVQINENNQGWVTVQTFNTDIGDAQNFMPVNINLDNYVGASIQIRFHFTGGWGWFWAVDNVVLTRNYLGGSISWSPLTNLYFDQAATIAYTGTPTNIVYYKGTQKGNYIYTASLGILNCSTVSDDVQINVYETDAPTGPATQTFIAGATLSDLVVTGQNLSWYIKDANGDLNSISVNTALVDATTYYVTQTLNGCESIPLEITVSQDCPAPSNVQVTAASDGSTAEAIVTWDAPTNIAGVLNYHVLITDITDLNNQSIVYDDDVTINRTFEIIDDLPLEHTFRLEVYSVCDPTVPVYGPATVKEFTTVGLGTTDVKFVGLNYYPNPTRGIVYFENKLPIEKIQVFSISGKTILTKKSQDSKVMIDFSSLASGTYMVAISVGNSVKVIQIIRE